MSADTIESIGPDLTEGVTLADFEGRQMLRGHVGKSRSCWRVSAMKLLLLVENEM